MADYGMKGQYVMTHSLLQWLKRLIEEDNLHAFYTCPEWLHLRGRELVEDKGECQICKRHGRYKRAVIVHHVNHVRSHPELALSRTYIDGSGREQRNLLSVCRDCHETECHPERMRKQEQKLPVTPERW